MMHSKLKLVGFILVVLILFSGCISGNKGESTSTQSTGTEPVHYGPITPALEFTPVTPTPVWASKDVELQGDVYGIAVGTSSGPIPYIHTIQFKIKLATGGGPRDISRSKLTWQTKTILRNLDYGGTGSPDPLLYQWKIDMSQGDTDTMLEGGEEFTITAKIGDSSSNGLLPNRMFAIELEPEKESPTLEIIRFAPAIIENYNKLG